jgi:glucose-6-phosphate-specific signal transduction histidine kinase
VGLMVHGEPSDAPRDHSAGVLCISHGHLVGKHQEAGDLMFPWVVLLGVLAGAYYWHKTKSAERGFGAGLALWAGIALVSFVLLMGGLATFIGLFAGLTGAALVGAIMLPFAALFAGLTYVGWRMYKHGD